MLQITNTLINKDGQYVKDKITYAIHYIITNGELTSVQCAISTEDGDKQFIQIGYIRKENGRISTDFNDFVSPLAYLTVFEGIIKEIEADTNIAKS